MKCRILSALCLASLCLLSLRAAAPAPVPPPSPATASIPAPAPAWPQATTDIPADPAVTWGRLDNGLRYAILPNAEPKERVSVRLLVKAGALMETDAQQGLAHFTEHMGFKGTRNFPPGKLVEYFQRLGMSFGPDTNASTGFERTMYQVELPKNDAKALNEAFTALRDYADGDLFIPAEIEHERGVILAEQRDRDSVEFRAAKAEYKFVLPDTRIPQRWPIGQIEIIRTAPREQFADFYDTWYRPERMAVVVVGPVKPEEVAPLLAAAFGDMKDRAPARPEPDLGHVSIPDRVSARLHRDPELSRLTVSLQTTEPYAFEPDTVANRLKYLPRQLAYSMINRRLEELAKKPGAPFTSASAGTTEFLDFVRNSSMEVVTTKPEQWKAALAVAEQELRRALSHGFQPAELREVTANMANDLEEEVKQAPTRRSSALCAELIDSIAHDNVFDLPSTRRDILEPALASVTPADCLAALREAWKAPGRLIFVSGNLELASPETDLVAAYKESEAVAVAAPAQIEEGKWGYTDFGPAGAVASRRTATDLGIEQVEFKNGVHLNLKNTAFETATIHLGARLGGGLLTQPADKPGLNLYTSIASSQMGLGKHSADDLRRLLAGRSISGGLGVANDAFTLSGRTTPQDLELELQYLAAWASDPGYRTDSERLIAGQLTQHYQQLSHSPDGVLQLETFREIAGGDPRLGMPSFETISRYSMADVRAWLTPQLAAGPLELSIVGDIDIDATIALVAKTFGALPARTAKPAYAEQRKVAFPATGLGVERKVQTQIPRGVVFVSWPTSDMWDISRTRRLNLLADVIDDRLRVKIREGLGGAYSPSAQSACSDTFTAYGYLLTYVGVDPAQAPAILAAVREIAESLRKGGVTADELERAKQPVLTTIIESERQNGYWLGSVLGSAAEYPQRLDWARNRRADITAVTPAELSALAAQYLLPNRAVSYVILPEPLPEAIPALPAKPLLPAAAK